MNNENNENTTGNGQSKDFRPRLSFYHPNKNGNGSATAFEVVPATGDRDGAVFLSLANQKSVSTGSATEGNKKFATFDWQNKITVKLNFTDLSGMILVFRGQAESLGGGKGLFHDSKAATTAIGLSRQKEFPRLHLDVSRKPAGDDASPSRVRITFNDTEAAGLGLVLEQILALVAFGIPKDRIPIAADDPAF